MRGTLGRVYLLKGVLIPGVLLTQLGTIAYPTVASGRRHALIMKEGLG